MIKNESLSSQAYNLIMSDIISQVFKPDDVLTERGLVEKYGYSRTPIREALISLCSDGVLRSIPRYGYEVLRLTLDDVREMLQFRYILEGGLITFLADPLTEHQINKLVSIDQKCASVSGNIWMHWQCNSVFHIQLLSYCGNAYAVSELERCLNRLKRAYAQCYWDFLENAFVFTDTRTHADLIECLRDHDMKNFLKLLKEDLNSFGGLDNPMIPKFALKI